MQLDNEQLIEKLSDLPSFIRYLEQTSDSEWQVDTVRNSSNSKNCVFGHLVNWVYGKNYKGIVSDAWDLFEEMWATTFMLYPINDGQHINSYNFSYNQPTPKRRVIAYLKNLWLGLEAPTWQLFEEHKQEVLNG